jgi:hypothetical protein
VDFFLHFRVLKKCYLCDGSPNPGSRLAACAGKRAAPVSAALAMSSPNWLVLLLVMSASIGPCTALQKCTWKMGKWTITKYLERFNEIPAEAMIVVYNRFKKDALLDTVGVFLTLVN